MTADSLVVTLAMGSRCQGVTVFGAIFLSVIQVLCMSLTPALQSLYKETDYHPSLLYPREPMQKGLFLSLSIFLFLSSLPPVLSNLKKWCF